MGSAAPAGRLLGALRAWMLCPAASLDPAAGDLAPDVVQIIALAQGRDNGQADLCHRGPEAIELPTIVRWCKGVRR